jgi:hypothetical protein
MIVKLFPGTPPIIVNCIGVEVRQPWCPNIIPIVRYSKIVVARKKENKAKIILFLKFIY